MRWTTPGPAGADRFEITDRDARGQAIEALVEPAEISRLARDFLVPLALDLRAAADDDSAALGVRFVVGVSAEVPLRYDDERHCLRAATGNGRGAYRRALPRPLTSPPGHFP